MKLERPLLSAVTAALLCGSFTTFALGQQAAAGAAVQAQAQPQSMTVPASAVTDANDAALLKSTQPLTEDALRSRLVGKLIFLRGSYMGDELNFDQTGKITGSATSSSFTLSAFEVQKVKLTKQKLELEADRYGLHYLGALPFDDGSKTYDKVKISKKPVHITIDREIIVIPKVKKEKKKKSEPTPQELAAAQTLKTRDAAASAPAQSATATPATVAAATPAPAAKPVVSSASAEEAAAAQAAMAPIHSAMVMNKALDKVFATDVDAQLKGQMPEYWQEYFNSKKQHRAYVPADTSVKMLGEGITAPKALTPINPSSNGYAQQYGIAGMELLRTVIDATGTPQQMAIERPIGFGLDEKAVEAVKNARFKPAMQNGQPVPVVIDLVVTFRIFSNRTLPGSVSKGEKEPTLAASVADADDKP